jgi:phosphoglycolate phosphatase-like HAD superfamily hydrolase
MREDGATVADEAPIGIDRPIDAVVFDLDGTLVDSLDTVLECYRLAIVELGGPDLDPASILSSFSLGPAARMLAVLIGAPVGPQAVRAYEAHLAARVDAIRPYPGVVEMLARLGSTYPLGVFTAADTTAAELILGASRLRPRFRAVVGADRVARTKPEPDGLLEIARILGTDVARIAYVGDGPADVASARACGARSIAAVWGGRFAPDPGADAVAATPGEVADHLLRGPA